MIDRLRLLTAIPAVLISVLAITPAQANNSTTLLGATGFNVFTLSDYTVNGTDEAGRIAVGGNFAPANNGSTTLVSNQSGTPTYDSKSVYDVVVAGNFTEASNSINGTGSVWVGGNATWNAPTMSGGGDFVALKSFTNSGGGSISGTIFTPSYNYGGGYNYFNTSSTLSTAQKTSPVDFVSADTQLPAYANQLSALSQTTGAIKSIDPNSKAVTLTATGCTLCVFNLTSTELNNALNSGSINLNIPTGATAVVNVNGQTINVRGGSISINGATDASNAHEVLWNFYNASTINYQTVAWEGSILAPGAAFVGANNGNINGQLIVYSDSGGVEIHNYLFDGTLPGYSMSSTPEPSSWMTALSAIALVGFSVRKKISSRS